MCIFSALYLVVIATTIALVGQHLVRKAIAILGRASVIIFILTLTLSVSVVLFGLFSPSHLRSRYVSPSRYIAYGAVRW
ncbi:sulfite exporter TauE/SafE family protein 3-like [Glycine soja]|uniref:sulfite exporter TauE/SafE family protein 3-like n=1 Tax=Glycine max TaxID=3847 RepID=UPI000E21BD24|nr:sulfite exporter TauE/SafE family protein 3-like [Glycine max]XP_028184149.1 sulfite exporter TauE/SafE family protein 3-like [Glycine soja]XP_040862299.1 sulfite exporter TauE/SafE family protein 3-like [Glycine max]|eukprot:XP_025979875.1 sulfite exporter TauE/SafE family protein 3-like [Glycine max]